MLEDTKNVAALRRRYLQLIESYKGQRAVLKRSIAANKRLREELTDEKILRQRAESDLKDALVQIDQLKADG